MFHKHERLTFAHSYLGQVERVTCKILEIREGWEGCGGIRQRGGDPSKKIRVTGKP